LSITRFDAGRGHVRRKLAGAQRGERLAIHLAVEVDHTASGEIADGAALEHADGVG
jgi:hypothetical protein